MSYDDTYRSPCLEPWPYGCPFQYQDKRIVPCIECAARKPFQPPDEALGRKIQKRKQGGKNHPTFQNPEVMADIVALNRDGVPMTELARQYGCSSVTIRQVVKRRGIYSTMDY